MDEKQDQDNRTGLSRRKFLKLAALSAGSLVVGNNLGELERGTKKSIAEILTDGDSLNSLVATAAQSSETISLNSVSAKYGVEKKLNPNYLNLAEILNRTMALCEERYPKFKIGNGSNVTPGEDKSKVQIKNLLPDIGLGEFLKQVTEGNSVKLMDLQNSVLEQNPYLKAAAKDFAIHFRSDNSDKNAIPEEIIGSSQYSPDRHPDYDYFFQKANDLIGSAATENRRLTVDEFIVGFLKPNYQSMTVDLATGVMDAAIGAKLLARNFKRGDILFHIRQGADESELQKIAARFDHFEDCSLSVYGNWMKDVALRANLEVDCLDRNASVINAIGGLNHQLYILALSFYVHPVEIKRSVFLQQIGRISEQGWVKVASDLKTLKSLEEAISIIRRLPPVTPSISH